MASPVNALLCALIATAFWTTLGLAPARYLLPRVLSVGAAPVIGWALHSAIALPIYILIGLSPASVATLGAVFIVISGISLSASPAEDRAKGALTAPLWALVVAGIAAGLLAFVPAAAILPKFHGASVQLADQIFDHSKSAIVDAIARLGVPPVNPIFGEFGAPGRLAYYYLWHFSAAELALVTGASGWEADIGLTWFTAFASLALMMSLAVWISKRAAAAPVVVVLAAAGSLWTTLYWLCGTDNFTPVLEPPIGMGGWLFQAAWVPQHLMASSCALAAMVLLARMTRQHSWAAVLLLALLVVAGFESSAFVGGITFAIAVAVAAPLVFVATEPARRRSLALALAIAVVLVICLIAPFVRDQMTTLHARDVGSPVVVSPYAVFGEFLPSVLRRVLDIPGYWLIILPAELPAVFVAGLIALAAALRGSGTGALERTALVLLACLAGTGLIVSWLLVSTLGQNNDLRLRAIIPAFMVLIVCAGAAAAGLLRGRARTIATLIAFVGLVLSLPNTVDTVRYNFTGDPRPGGEMFAQSPELWAAVRRLAPPAARIANNPMYLGQMTPWPVNISWALLANRSSCFAGPDLALAFAPLSAARRAAISDRFDRVFAGEGTPADMHALAAQYGCQAVVLVPSDKAWAHDTFATSSDYRLAEERAGRWRIYLRR